MMEKTLMERNSIEFDYGNEINYSDNRFEQRIIPLPEEQLNHQKVYEKIYNNVCRDAFNLNASVLLIKKKNIIDKSFEYLINHPGENILDDVQKVLEKCDFRMLSPRNIKEASLIYAFSIGIQRSEWKNILSQVMSNIKNIDMFKNQNTTYGELKQTVADMSNIKDGKYITQNYTSETLWPALRHAIDEKNFSLFYDGEIVKDSLVLNYKKTIYYFNKFLLGMIEDEIKVLLRYFHSYKLVDESVVKTKPDDIKTLGSQLENKSLMFFGKTCMCLKGTRSLINEKLRITKKIKKLKALSSDDNKISIDNPSLESILTSEEFEKIKALSSSDISLDELFESILAVEDYEKLKALTLGDNKISMDELSLENFLTIEDFKDIKINYDAIAVKFSKFLGYSNITHPLYRVLHDIKGAKYMETKDEIEDISFADFNSFPENEYKYYIWWKKINGIMGDNINYRELYEEENSKEDCILKGFRSRIRILFKDVAEENYKMPSDIGGEFQENEYKKIMTYWGEHMNKWTEEMDPDRIIKRRNLKNNKKNKDKKTNNHNNSTTRKKMVDMLVGTREKQVTRNYLALFGVFTGNNISYVSDCLAKCGYRQIDESSNSFDKLVCDIDKTINTIINSSEKHEEIYNYIDLTDDRMQDLNVVSVRKCYQEIFEIFLDKHIINRDIKDSNNYGNPIIREVYEAVREIVYKYESDISASSVSFFSNSVYGTISNDDKKIYTV